MEEALSDFMADIRSAREGGAAGVA
jgi:hypothetical protein